MSKEKEPFKITELEKLPKRKFPAKVLLYDLIIEDIERRGKGVYKIEVPNRKATTVYSALNKRVKDREDIKLHFIGGVVQLEVL